jgi:hypothetical protein
LKLIRAVSEAEQSIKECRDSQLLLSVVDPRIHWRRKAKWNFTVSVKTPKVTEEKAALKVL